VTIDSFSFEMVDDDGCETDTHPTATIGFTPFFYFYPFSTRLFVFSFLPDGWMVVRFVSEIGDH
jgi:hypothetical protein